LNKEWLEDTASELTDVLAAIMQVKPSAADRIVNASVAKLGVVGATAGVYGLASLVGTAGTGTAIGTLSGAAANSATLAWIGGSVFTGTIVLVGIAGLTGWGAMRLWKGKPREYSDLAEIEQNIVIACAILAKAFKEEASSHNIPSKAVMEKVVGQDLKPLLKTLDEYLTLDQYSEIATGNLSVSGRTRLYYRFRKLSKKTKQADLWVEQYVGR
jgi:hypothetical protein